MPLVIVLRRRKYHLFTLGPVRTSLYCVELIRNKSNYATSFDPMELDTAIARRLSRGLRVKFELRSSKLNN